MPKFVKYLSYVMLATAFVLGVVFYFNLDNGNMVEALLYYAYALFAFAFATAYELRPNTKPNPFERPVSLSVTTLAEVTSPYSVNNSAKSASLML